MIQNFGVVVIPDTGDVLRTKFGEGRGRPGEEAQEAKCNNEHRGHALE